ncbi:T9SS type A sorting domain-containing protein [Marivirga tractuosa]|uniref:T9SS type A sorting domain-containing protein n=1 Tax=Marivirga tractuosa TaxID=1006 RepID=UPI0035CFE230
MKNSIILIIALALFLQNNLFSQQAINASGGNLMGEGGSIAFSVGQLTTAPMSSEEGSVTPGVLSSVTLSVLSTTPEVANILIFPNPTNSKIQINFGESALGQNTQYRLFDANGRAVKSGKLEHDKTEINLLNLPSSLYFLHILDQSRVLKTIKIVKEN